MRINVNPLCHPPSTLFFALAVRASPPTPRTSPARCPFGISQFRRYTVTTTFVANGKVDTRLPSASAIKTRPANRRLRFIRMLINREIIALHNSRNSFARCAYMIVSYRSICPKYLDLLSVSLT